MENSAVDLMARVRAVKERQKKGSVLWAGALRPLTEQETTRLRKNGNLIDPQSQIYAGPEFTGDGYHFNRLGGRCVLGRAKVIFSSLEDVEIGNGAFIEHCPLVRRTAVGESARLRGVSVDCSSPASPGWTAVVSAGLETRGRELCIHPEIRLDEAVAGVRDPHWSARIRAEASEATLTVSVLGRGCELVDGGRLDRVWIDPGVRVAGALKVENSCLLGEGEETAFVGTGCIVTDSVIQWGASVDTGAQVHSSILLEHSHAEKLALIHASLIGPNTSVAEGEVTACLLGPFIGFHHQSLLISAWWPEGRGNVGYGANIGSNHTSRAPDQEIRPGEGVFFGLSSSVKFPANFEDAPYSLIATGATTLPQRLAMPFSLIMDEKSDLAEFKGLNRLIPGWVLIENVYALLRNERKYKERNRARRHRFDFRIFRPEIVDKLQKARDLLAGLSGKAAYGPTECSALGKNFMLESDRQAAVRVYTEFVSYACLRLFAEKELLGGEIDGPFWESLREASGWKGVSEEVLLVKWLESEKRLWSAALAAKEKDDRRGLSVIPDYLAVHGPAREDGFLQSSLREIETWESLVRSVVDNVWKN